MTSNYHLNTKKSWDDTIKDLAKTFELWGVRSNAWRVEPMRPPRARNQHQSRDERTVTITFTKRERTVAHQQAAQSERTVTLTMHQQDTAQNNLRVLYLIIEALRMNEVRGHAQLYAEAARQLYPALPAPTSSAPAMPASSNAYAVLFVQPNAPIEVCEAAYKALARRYHPDTGGATADTNAMVRITQAIDIIRKERS